MSAIVPKSGPTRQLDRAAEPGEQLTEEQAKDPARIARIIMGLLRDVATAKRRWWPRRIDFEDVPVDATGTTVHRFPHGFDGRVRWWVVEWSAASGAPSLRQDASTDAKTLALVSDVAGTVTLRVEVAG